MKKIYTIGMITMAILASAPLAISQNSDTLSYAENDVRKHYGIYHLAKRYNDPVVARMALYQILVFSPNEKAVLDSLAIEYFQQNNYVSAALVAKDNIEAYKSETALEIGAASLSSLGVKDKALEYYEDLALINNSTGTHYQIAFLQYEMKRYEEAKTTLEILMKRPEIDTVNLIFPRQDQSNQEVVMRAALQNLQGLISAAEGNIEEAKGLYLEALKTSPGFEVAQLNLRSLAKKEDE